MAMRSRSDEAEPTEFRPNLLTWLRGRFRLLYLAPLLAIAALLAWTLASPMGSAPDDDYHLASIWCANPLNTDACEHGAEPNSRLVPEAIRNSACYAGMPEVSGSCQLQFPLDQNDTVETDRGNFLGQYPPVFYTVMSVLAGPDILASVLLMRLLNVLLFVGLTVALCVLLPPAQRIALIGGWLIASVPLGIFLLASNNPSSWALIGVGSSWLALLGFFGSTGRRRIALGVLYVVAVVIAAGARTDAALYVVLGSAIAIWLTFRRDRGYLLSALLPVVMTIVAIAFYLGSGQQAVASTGLGSGDLQPVTPLGSHAPTDGFGRLAYNLLYVPTLWVGALGQWGLGWLDTTVPPVVWVGAAGVFAAVVFAGLVQNNTRKALAVIGMALVLWLLPTYVLMRGGNIVGENVQPRYLLPLIVLLGGLALLPAGDRLLRLSWLQLSIIGATLAVANAFALHSNIRRYVTGVDESGVNLDAGAEWWWPVGPSPMATWIIGTLAYAGLLAVFAWEVKRRGIFRDDRTLA
ncbi:MAG: DUF2142 domain-containing protein [Pseudolysinimonas sp.]